MILSTVNSKGGVGKSTIAVHLAISLREAGHDVCFVDADAQECGSRWMRAARPEIPVYRLLDGHDLLDQVPGLPHDCIVADGPGGLAESSRALMLVSELVLMPVGPSSMDLLALQQSLEVLKGARRIRKGKPKALVIPNRLRSRARLSEELLESTKDLRLPVTGALFLRDAYADAAGQGTVVWRMPGKAAAEMQLLLQEINGYIN